MAWPSQPNIVGAPRNDGVMAQVSMTAGSIGYVESFFASSTNSPVARLENASGEFVAPGVEGGLAALAGGVVEGDDLRVWVTDPNDPQAYPIVTYTWMLFYRDHGNAQMQEALRNFVAWAMADGQDMAADLGYIPLPEDMIKRVLAQSVNIR